MTRKAQNMVKYVIKRILIMFPMLILVLIVTWILSNMMQVSPVMNKISGFVEREVIEAEKIRSGFYQPWFVKLGIYLKNFIIGDWGESYVVLPGKSVIQVIAEVFPKTIELMIIPIFLSPIIAVKLGVIASKNKDKMKDTLIRFVAILGAGFPVFWIATIFQIFFGVYVSDFTSGQLQIPVMLGNTPGSSLPGPKGGFRTGFRIIDSIIYNDQAFLWDTILHLVLPTICMVFVSLAGISRQTRSSMLDVLDNDYIRTARAKGVEEKDVINKHALRNALLPTSNLIIGGTAAAILGSLFVEYSFNYRGFGYWFVNAIFMGDYLVINGLMVFATIITLIGTLVADVMYTIIDPRIVYR